MTILDIIDTLTEHIDRLMELEECYTFDIPLLQEWINLLKRGDLKCPCQYLNIDITDCPFYYYKNCEDCNVCEDCECKDDCEYDHDPQECAKYCDDCEGYKECAYCPRSEIWDLIIQTECSLHMPNKLANWFIGQMIAKRLEEM